ncbi:TolC family protein [Janthinobacterium fluminis]|uniref:TolC family protein n=1 Tax=Janthinobacterium fluminis TaxID=2987524 RepID=A0ABT5K6V4_9BURK|nr:TolC family protein [Janthinobacterium fluminis]MDC8760741.1 TolC family protein [Janthinobacterium fluminis]
MYRFLLPLSVAVCAMPAAARDSSTQEPAATLTLPAALALAMRANPELSAARHEAAALDGAALQAAATPNPELQTLFEDSRRATRTSTVQLNQTLELGGKRAARMAVARHGQDGAAIDLAAQQAATRAAVAGAFFDVLAAQQRSDLADSAAALARKASEVAARRVVAGKASPVEETRARVAEAAARLDVGLAGGALAGARQRLAALWGNPAPRFTLADGRLDLLPQVPAAAELARRLAGAPAVLKAHSALAQRRAMADLESRRRMPDLTVSVGVKRAEEQGRNQAILGLSMPLPLFDNNRGNLLEALRRSDKARDELAAAELRTGTELAGASQRLQDARQEAAALRDEIVPGALSAYAAAAKGFEFGKFAFLDVLDAQRTLLQANTQYLRALSDAHKAAAEIDRILGAAAPATE